MVGAVVGGGGRTAQTNLSGARVQDKPQALDTFLESVERRAFRLARYATRNDDDALDVVQEAMMRLVSHYADAGAQEWPMLFQRIMQNRIRDWQRRQIVRSRWSSFWSAWTDNNEADAKGPEPEFEDPAMPAPERAVAGRAAMIALQRAVEALPLRQQQSFLLRYVEGLDVAATAAAMQVSEGSVKTHTSRAIRALREALGPHWDERGASL